VRDYTLTRTASTLRLMREIVRKISSTLLIALLLAASAPAFAHDIPGKVTVLAFVKPQGEKLLVLARVPMEALTEAQYPMRGPGYLDFERAGPVLEDVAHSYLVQNIHPYADGKALGDGQLLKARVALPSDKSFLEFERALAHVNSPPLTNAEELYWKQALLDVLVAYPIASDSARFSLEANFDRLGMETHTVLRYVPPQGQERAFTYLGNPGVVQLEPDWWHATSRFVALGFFHILEGIDHLLFLLCLVIPVRSVRALVPVITAFTIAHSITLISSAFGLTPTALWFPALIETLIAVSVLYMACENIIGGPSRRRWLIVFAFGLVHGFGFSFILADRMQFAGPHLVSALLAFNVGVELGQLLVLLIAVPLLAWIFRHVKSEKVGVIVLSALVAHSAWHWFTERGAQLLQYRWQWPTLDVVFFAGAARWAMLVLGCTGVLWLMREIIEWFARRRDAGAAMGRDS
jgi:HupE / UreJ protein